MSDLEITGTTHSFSWSWVMASAAIITGAELAIGLALAPAVFAGRLASPMLQMRLEMIMHLASFYVGGVTVGVISPGVRLKEPAVGAVVAVLIVMLMSVFMPMHFFGFSLGKLVVAGGIAGALAISGAYTGERIMGNVRSASARRQQRLGTGSAWPVPSSSSREHSSRR